MRIRAFLLTLALAFGFAPATQATPTVPVEVWADQNDFRSVRNSRRIAERIGLRFHHYDKYGLKEPLAEDHNRLCHDVE